MVRDADCVFCKIIDGVIPAARVFENDHALAFLDVGPLNPGHTLVIPKAHYPTLADLPDEYSAATAALLPRMIRAVRSATDAAGLNVLVNIGRVAGQTVDHVHWHIIPRFAGDALHWPWPSRKYEGDAMATLRAAIAQALDVDSSNSRVRSA